MAESLYRPLRRYAEAANDTPIVPREGTDVLEELELARQESRDGQFADQVEYEANPAAWRRFVTWCMKLTFPQLVVATAIAFLVAALAMWSLS